MRARRALVGLAAVAAVLIVGGLRLAAASQRSSRGAPAVSLAVSQPVPRPLTLAQALQQYLQRAVIGPPRAATRPRIVVPPRVAGPGACFVVGGRCSLTPCVQFAQGGAPTAVAVSGAVLERATSVPARPGQPLSAGGSSCHRRLGTPRILRVVGP